MPGEGRTAPRPSARTRYRYVLFRLRQPATTERSAFIAALKKIAGEDSGIWLTRFDGTMGVVRCRRGGERAAVTLLTERLPTTGIQVDTLSTSGTIAALERRHRDLARGQRRQ